MSAAIASRVYDSYGRFYDAFDLLFKRRIARAIAGIPFRPGDRLLDIGVGTGLSLDFYPDPVHVTGVDLSAGMLRRAQRKLDKGLVRGGCPRSATRLLRGDALNLPFRDASFEVVFLSHVISTVPEPHRCLAEARRVACDDGLIVLVNHFRSPMPLLNWMESAIDPLCRRLGWRLDLSLAELLRAAGVSQTHRPAGLFFQTVYLQKIHDALYLLTPPSAAPSAPKPLLEPM